MTIEEAWASLQGVPSYVERYANAAPVPVIPMEDALIHTDEKPFCSDLTCPCHTQFEYHLAVAGFDIIGRL